MNNLNWSGANLNGLNLRKTDFSGADLSRAYMVETDLRGAQMQLMPVLRPYPNV
ncbi:pentapeptide repeat-containing protein [Candidatus Regiella endosymbiont of Tuberolachnus salignus]|uniref:pentapeptide repeat-containing protein n=1 Tax=Candidatus Regiella endosymbiont of Tuberolachnus salignus TaxID=3077956 RepID=UPI003BB1CA46